MTAPFPRLFRRLSDRFFASPQIDLDALADVKALGVALVISNRVDEEEPGQPSAAAVAEACRKEGLAFVHIPMGPGGLSHRELDAFHKAAGETDGAVLAFCKSGLRSVLLRSFAHARAGEDVEKLIAEARDAGFDLSAYRTALENLPDR